MSLDPAEVDARIAAAEEATGLLPAGSAEHRAAKVSLATALAARYVQLSGLAGDAERADRLAQQVLADPAVTADQRQSMSMVAMTLTMMRVTPAAALRGGGAGLDAEALRRTEQWRAENEGSTLTDGLAQLTAQIASIEDIESLPPQIQSALKMITAATGLLSDVAQPEWTGTVPPVVTAQLRDAVDSAPEGVPGTDLLRGLVVWVEGFDRADERRSRVSELEATITTLPEDALLTPVLQADLAAAVVRSPDLGGVGAASRVTELLRHAVEGMGPEHPLYAETVRMLAGGLVASAAETGGVGSVEEAERIAGQVLAGDAAADVDRAERMFLSALIALLPGSTRDVGSALSELVTCIELLPSQNPLRAIALGQFGAALADRSLVAGLLEDSTTAASLLDRAIAAAGPNDDAGSLLACVSGVVRVNAALHRDDSTRLATAAAELRLAFSGMPITHPFRANAGLVLAVAELRIASGSGEGLREAVAAVRQAAMNPKLSGLPRSATQTLIDTVDALAGLLDGDPAAVLAAADRMEAGLVAVDRAPHPLQRPAQLLLLGKALLVALDTGQAPKETADRAVRHLQEARGLLGPDVGAPMATVLHDLATALRASGDRAQSRQVAFDELQHHAGAVLLQSNASDAVAAAQSAAVNSYRLSRWCLSDGDLAGAVAAIELGRGLVLHATTTVPRVAEVLDAAGHHGLAERWRADEQTSTDDAWVMDAARGGLDPMRASDRSMAAGLRVQVVAVLRETPEARELFGAPPTRDMAAALGRIGADALVYLVPGGTEAPGQLLVVNRSGAVTALDAHGLRDTPTGPLATYLGIPGPEERDTSTWAWPAALGALCDWAGRGVLKPLRHAANSGVDRDSARVPKVVLVPCGRLGVVPWHAARSGGPTGPRYACQDYVLSTTASGRQLVEVAARTPAPVEAGVLLASGPWGGQADEPTPFDLEIAALSRAFYPSTTPEMGAAPRALLRRLPGSGSPPAGLVHLACHGTATDDPERSFLDLTAQLRVADVLKQGARRAREELGTTVVLSACTTGRTRSSHDEALSLATAFLAAGATTVVGSLWAVYDRFTGVLVFAFHHFLRAKGLAPAEALRAAQLWALDPDRQPLPRMPDEWRHRSRRTLLGSVEMWAGFTHHGW
jgi:hypothetical protein